MLEKIGSFMVKDEFIIDKWRGKLRTGNKPSFFGADTSAGSAGAEEGFNLTYPFPVVLIFYRLLLLISLLLLTFFLRAQQTQTVVDSLLNEIATAPSDSMITEHFNRFSRSRHSIHFRSPENAHALKEVIFASTQDTSLRHRAYTGIMVAFAFQNEADSVIHYSLEALPYFSEEMKSRNFTKELHILNMMYFMEMTYRWDDIIFWSDSLLQHHQMDTILRRDVHDIKHIALTERGDYAGALENSQQVLSLIPAFSEDGKYYRTMALRQLSELHRYNRNYSQSRRWAKEAITLATEAKDTFLLNQLLPDLGLILLAEGKTSAGREQILKTLPPLVQMEEAIQKEFDERAEDIDYEPAYDYWMVKGISIPARVGLIESYLKEKNLNNEVLQKNIAHVKQLIEENEEYTSIIPKLNMLAVLAEYYSQREEHNSALKYGYQQLALAEENTKKFSPHLEQALRLLHDLEKKAGHTEAAYNTLLRHRDYVEGLKSQVDGARLARAEANINLDEYARAREAAERATIAEREAAALRSRYFTLALLGGSIVLGILAWAYRRSRRDQQLIKEQNQLVTQSLGEKEVLLREIHHRVKNNLQIISSLLQKQGRLANDADAQKLAKEGQERIQSMALIHENLYQSEQLSGVNIKSYLEDLGANIGRSHQKEETDIKLDLLVADEYLDLDTAIPVGLILNELLTNAYKYAFPNGGSGQIQVIFQRITDQFELEVSDNGIGLPADHAARSSQSLGHNLVKGLVRQLDGTMKWLSPEKGTHIHIKF